MKKYLIITGASKGIGFATAKKFLENDWQVINISRSNCNLDKVINIQADLLKEDWQTIVEKNLASIFKEKTKISLIHNSAMMEKDSVFEFDANKFRNVMELNVIAPAILNKLVSKYFDKTSSILYVGSTLSEKAVKNTLSYVTSKHALIGLMRSTVQDLAGTGIHSACICPGFTDTEMLREHIGNNQEIIDSISSIICAGRLVKTEEIAELLYFSALNPAINGAVLHANLGNIER